MDTKWEMTTERRPGLRLLIGKLPRPGIPLTITDPWGNVVSIKSGSKPEYGPGGFETPIWHKGVYTIRFLDQTFYVEIRDETVIVTFTERPIEEKEKARLVSTWLFRSQAEDLLARLESSPEYQGIFQMEEWETERINGIPARALGRTGVRVTILGLGGYHIGIPTDPEVGIRIIRTAIDEGINFLDNAWSYHQGESERIMGRALRDGYREKVFLMTKNHGRDGATFRSQLEESLQRLQTDYIDLLQFHEIIQEGEPDRIFSEGAIEEAIKAREAGKIRFIGFTGHRWPYLLRQMLDKDFPWDTAQLPVNLLDFHYRSFTQEVLPLLTARGIGIIGMKSLAGGEIFKAGVTAKEAISYALSLPIHTLVVGMDSLEILSQNLEIVRVWTPLTGWERNRLLEQVAPWAEDGRLEFYKTG